MEMTNNQMRILSKRWEIQEISDLIEEKAKKRFAPDPYIIRRRFRKFYNDTDISDLTITVGKSKSVFKLHKTIVCGSSGYFKGASNHFWSQTLITGVWLAYIEVAVFEVIALWMYGYGYTLPCAPLGRRFIKDTYIAADYLLVAGLKKAIIYGARDFWNEEMLKRSFDLRFDTDPYDLFRTLCAYAAGSSERDGLYSCAIIIIKGFGSKLIGPPRFVNVGDDDDSEDAAGVSRMFKLLREAYREMIRGAICSDCYPKWMHDCRYRHKCGSMKCRSAQELLSQSAEKNPFNTPLLD
ncbi:hypothetical protein TWF506_005849 [Arthrobotrys conoides]|uniref:BTB domain-containing protein n=1 Tax=Arthrobotrys conoides TaxID=74498 RepID=A0AAN8S3W6_9PEZI